MSWDGVMRQYFVYDVYLPFRSLKLCFGLKARSTLLSVT